MANKNLNAAKEAKKDEFYTQLEDINNELRHYREHFRGKTVLCNCDDPRVSYVCARAKEGHEGHEGHRFSALAYIINGHIACVPL